MIRVMVVVAMLCVAVLIYLYGGSDTIRDQRETTLERSKEIGDAIKDSDAQPSWRDQLRSRHQ